MRRRAFLGTSAALTLAAPELTAANDSPLRVGFVGVGNRGSTLLKTLLGLKGVAVTAVCDLKPAHSERAAKLITDAGQPAPKLTAEWKELSVNNDLDAIVSALPCDLHAAHYLDVIAAGKHLYGEKPMCLTVEDCDKVVAAAEKGDKTVQIGFQRRADPRFHAAMAAVHGGELGELVEGRVCWSNAWGPLGDWFGQRARSGDWMVEQACHNWDVLNWATRSLPVRAVGLGRKGLYKDFQPERDIHDYYSAVVEYPGGVVVNILHSWVGAGQNGKFNKMFNDEYTRLFGTKGAIDFNTGTLAYRKELDKPERALFAADKPIDNTREGLAAFVESVRAKKPPVATVKHGRDAVIACLMVRAAVDKKGVAEQKDIGA